MPYLRLTYVVDLVIQPVPENTRPAFKALATWLSSDSARDGIVAPAR